MLDLEVIADPAAAVIALDPVRTRILAALRQPASAAGVAAQLGLPRQKVNYHLRTLEAHGLVEVAETRRWGGLVERLLVATAAGYVVSPEALGPAAPDPGRTRDRLSAGYLVALAARVVREVGGLSHRAAAEQRPLSTFALDAEIRFGSPDDRAAFARELAGTVATLAARYHRPDDAPGRVHRVLVGVHPIPPDAESPGPGRPAAPAPRTTTPTPEDPR